MLPRSKRVSTKLFAEVLKKGKTHHSPHFSLRIVKNSEEKVSRFSVSVPKKVEKTAVKRNNVRRRALAVIEQNFKAIPAGFNGIFFAKSGAYSLTSPKLKEEISFLLKKI
jgi:ribonuclease P protein component